MLGRVALDRVTDNPFQTRRDYVGIGELADSICKMAVARPETSGLIHVPVGRIVLDGIVLDPLAYGGVDACLGDNPEAVVQLAAGHRRLRAFAHLVGVGYAEYGTFPVEVQAFYDQAMADIAWEENLKRQDLTAIEEAEALRQAMDAFGWTQAQVGERRGLSQPAVANKLRLLGLPDDAQAAMRRGEITERHGRALLKALGKSPRIYEKAALDILPLPVDERVAAKAREEVGDAHVWTTARSLADAKGRCCFVCGGGIGHPASDGVPTFVREGNGGANLYLCLPCARAAQGWEVPSTAEAEDLVERAIRQESRHLDPDEFPLSAEVPGVSYLVEGVAVQARINEARCVDCRLCERQDKELWCLDRLCHHDKKELWFAALANQLALAVRTRWPGEAIPPILREWGGYDLLSWSEADKAMVESGHCGPHCERLRFRYSTSNGVRLVEGLPFILNCNNTNSHTACQRRYLKSLETEDQVAAARMKEKVEEGRKKEARAMIARAEASVAKALYEMHEGAWARLARNFVGTVDKGNQSVAASVSQIAARLVGGSQLMNYVTWGDDGAEERFGGALGDVLRQMGVGLAPGVEEIAAKLEKMKAFLLDDNGMPRAGLTPEQVTGNLANLEKLADLVRKIGSDQDRERLLGWIERLRELFPGK